MPAKPFNYQSVAGDYQYQAMRHGFPMQRFWHKSKLIFWDEIIAPQLIKDDSSGPIIEIGCGAGLLLQHLASWPQMKIGTDINFQAFAFLSGRFHELGEQASLSPVCSNGEKPPFKNDGFGGLILSEVLEHLHQPHQVLKEAFRVVKPGGWCYLTPPQLSNFLALDGENTGSFQVDPAYCWRPAYHSTK
jgi:SAM-dependent methyltransferase